MTPTVEFLSLSVAARRLGTNNHRVRALVALCGIEPGLCSGRWVITPEQFAVIARAHHANPPRPRGNPDWSGRPSARQA